MRSSPLTKSSIDSAARAADIGQKRIARERAPERRNAAYVADPTPVQPGKRRVLLDLAPQTVESLRDAISEWARPSDMCDPIERLLIEALEKAR